MVLIPVRSNVPLGVLLSEALDAGCRFRWVDGQLQIGGRAGGDPRLLSELIERRDELAELLQTGPEGEVCLGGCCYRFETWYGCDWWPGQQLGPALALDCETTRIESRSQLPRLVLASASDGQTHVLIHSSDLAAFIRQHASATIVCHNAAFDFWVLLQHFAGDADAQQRWCNIADSGRLRDSMLLDSLYHLARNDTFPRPRDLATVAKEYTNIDLDKSDPCRTRYGLIVGHDWSEIPRPFFSYAAADAIATFLAYDELIRRVRGLEADYGIGPEVIARWGHLTERIQVHGAIALAEVERFGVYIDRQYLGELRRGLEQQRDDLVDWMEQHAPGLLERGKDGELVTSTKTAAPNKSNKVLLPMLEGIADELGIEPRRTATGRISTSRSDWQAFEDVPFIANWTQLEEVNKLLGFFAGLDGDRIHPRYSILVRTGRTSSYGPNIQQLPRDGHLREAIVAPEGHSLYAVDYAFVELRTLAAVCEARYGYSQLANVIRRGTDPHCFVAAMFEGVSLDEFLSWKSSDRKRYATLRQRAKALNFGIPGGLGAKTLVDYAAATCRVSLTLEEAQRFRRKLITEVFPELNQYLSEDAHSCVARQLQCDPRDLAHHFSKSGHLGCMRRIVGGQTAGSNGKQYSQNQVDVVWRTLKQLNRNPDLASAIAARDTSETTGLARRLSAAAVVTLTGRVRGAVSFTAARNTPFQGLAADGAKLALYRLIRAGYRVHAFVHDEFLLSIPDSADWSTEPRNVDRICCEAMAAVCGTVPIAVEGARMKRWYKQAQPVTDAHTGTLLVWSPDDD